RPNTPKGAKTSRNSNLFIERPSLDFSIITGLSRPNAVHHPCTTCAPASRREDVSPVAGRYPDPTPVTRVTAFIVHPVHTKWPRQRAAKTTLRTPLVPTPLSLTIFAQKTIRVRRREHGWPRAVPG